MRIKDGFIYRQVAGQHVIIPIGEKIADFNGVLNLNETAAFMWNELQAGKTRDDLVQALVSAYEVSVQEAETDVDAFVAMLAERQILGDE